MTMLYKEAMPEHLAEFEKGKQYVSMVKADGDNFQIDLNRLRLINRHENDYTLKFPEIIAGLNKQDCVLNGEIAYWDKERQIFDLSKMGKRTRIQKEKDIQRRSKALPCKIYVFDLIEYKGIQMANNPEYPFKRRYEILQTIVKDNEIMELLPVREDIMQHFREEANAGREGIMLKKLDNIYIHGRTKTILKVKNWQYENVRFDSFEECPQGIVLTNDIDRVLCSGKQSRQVRAMIIQSGGAVCKVRHLQARTDKGKLREGTFKGLMEEEIMILEG